MTTSDWINLGTTIATILGVVVAVVALWIQIAKLNQQLKLQHFADYTKRYQEIILQFPEDINELSFVLAPRHDYPQTMRQMRTYFDLCFEEWYLKQRHLIDEETWTLWKAGMKTALSKPAFKQAWNLVKKDTSFGVEFEKYIENLESKPA